MVLLVKCVRSLGRGSYGEIAHRSIGAAGMWAVDLSILLSQIGFVCSEMLYVAKNCAGAISAYGVESPWFSETSILLLQLLVAIPMSWIQKLKYFQVLKKGPKCWPKVIKITSCILTQEGFPMAWVMSRY